MHQQHLYDPVSVLLESRRDLYGSILRKMGGKLCEVPLKNGAKDQVHFADFACAAIRFNRAMLPGLNVVASASSIHF